MRIVEERHNKELWLLWKLGNLTALDSDWVKSIGLAWLFKEDGKWKLLPRVTGNTSLFYNSIFFIRYTICPMILVQALIAFLLYSYAGAYVTGYKFLIPFAVPPGLFFAFRWSSATDKKALFQTGIGWKLNGRLGLLFRFQSDKTSAAGVTGPNFGQATGFNYGPH